MRVVDSQKNAQVFKALYTFLRESMNFIEAPVSEVKKLSSRCESQIFRVKKD